LTILAESDSRRAAAVVEDDLGDGCLAPERDAMRDGTVLKLLVEDGPLNLISVRPRGKVLPRNVMEVPGRAGEVAAVRLMADAEFARVFKRVAGLFQRVGQSHLLPDALCGREERFAHV